MNSCAKCGGDLTGRKNFCGHSSARIGAEESVASEELIFRALCSDTKRSFLVWSKHEGSGIWYSQGTSGDEFFLNYPYIVIPEFLGVDANEDRFLNVFKPSVVRNFQVDQAPQGASFFTPRNTPSQQATGLTTGAAPALYHVSLEIEELMIFTRYDVGFNGLKQNQRVFSWGNYTLNSGDDVAVFSSANNVLEIGVKL